MSRTVVIGDIHGCYNTLLSLLDEVKVDYSSDKLIFLGDYIDRGLYSREVVKLLRDLQERMTKDRCICLLGNHEVMAIESTVKPDLWEANGGYATVWSYRDDIDELARDIQWMHKELPLVAQDDGHIYVHAGLAYPLLEDCSYNDLLWDRSWLKSPNLVPREKPVIFGHTPFNNEIKYLPNGDIGIDGGCAGGGTLNALAIAPSGAITEYKVKRDPKDACKDKIREMLAWYNGYTG